MSATTLTPLLPAPPAFNTFQQNNMHYQDDRQSTLVQPDIAIISAVSQMFTPQQPIGKLYNYNNVIVYHDCCL